MSIKKVSQWLTKLKPVSGWNFKPAEQLIFDDLDRALQAHPEFSQYTDIMMLAQYYTTGAHSFTTKPGHIVYPGESGTRGICIEGLEGFARIAPLLATLGSFHQHSMQDLNNRTINPLTFVIEGMTAGTNPDSASYWGNIGDYDQRLVEASDIAITLFIIHSKHPELISNQLKEQVVKWLSPASKVARYGGNWCLFKIVILSCLQILTNRSYSEMITSEFEYFEKMHQGKGWFADGINGEIDYYNAWQMQYKLYWINQINPSLSAHNITTYNLDFSSIYKYLISPQGIPIFGRSICYRLAVSTPLVISAIYEKQYWGLAKRSFNVTHQYFIKNGALRSGRPTQGYFSQAPHVLENYSGRGSALWSSRSLTMLLQFPPDHAYWETSESPLPVEVNSYEKEYDYLGMTVSGDKNTQEIILRRSASRFNISDIEYQALQPKRWREFAQVILRRPLREENFPLKYGQKAYSSHHPLVDREPL